MTSIPRLEGLQAFVRRAATLNQLHNPDDPVAHHLTESAEEWQRLTDPSDPKARPASEVASVLAARKAITAIHRSFPAAAPAHEQAAHLLRGFCGLQPFAAGSDLTGWDLMAETLEHHGLELLAESEDGRQLLTELWGRLQKAYPDGFKSSALEAPDAAQAWLANWLRTRIVASGARPDKPNLGTGRLV